MVLKIFNDTDDTTSNSFFVDVEIKYLFNNDLYWMIGSRKLSCSYDICFPNQTIEFKNVIIKVPNDINKYLEALYGNWNKIVKQWSYDQYSNIKEEI